MTITVAPLDPRPAAEGGTGTLQTERGDLPLHRLDVRTAVTGLVARTEVVQGFRNAHDVALEATYVFPLPDRAALTAMRMTSGGREIVADLRERALARAEYDAAIEAGHTAAIAEEERPDVFTMRVGNIDPGADVRIALTLVGPLPYEDGAATYRFPLVVAPRYIPGTPLEGTPVGDGYAPDTDAVPDASRITPPILVPGVPNPVALSAEIALDPAGFTLGELGCSLPVEVSGSTLRVRPGQRLDRDLVLRLPYDGDASSLVTAPDGTFQLTVLPPAPTAGTRPRDVVLLLDRSGSMGGWKMVAARRAAARIVDTLGARDRFAALTFDNVVDGEQRLVEATDRHRFRAVERLARVEARGGTELLTPLQAALALLTDETRERVLVLVTDGQVGNEDQILATITAGLDGVRVHTVGIDEAVNAGFLGRLASVGGGRCELVESESRLDDAMAAIHSRITAPLVRSLRVDGEITDVTPSRIPDLFPGVPLVIRGRGTPSSLTGVARDGSRWAARLPAPVADPTVVPLWARARLRDLEDAYVADPSHDLEHAIVTLSLAHSVLCRFTAYVAVDPRTGEETSELHRVIQPVELPAGWSLGGVVPLGFRAAAAAPMFAAESAAAPAMARAVGAAGRPARTAGAFGRRGDPAWSAYQSSLRPFDDAVASVRLEAERMSDMPDAGADREDALDDLATRLEAVLAMHRLSKRFAASLREVIALIRDESISSAQRWEQVRTALPLVADDQRFWKRG